MNPGVSVFQHIVKTLDSLRSGIAQVFWHGLHLSWVMDARLFTKHHWLAFFILLLGPVLSWGQIQINPRYESMYRTNHMSLDLPAINDWIEATKTQSLELSLQNWSMLTMSLEGNFKQMFFCHNRMGPANRKIPYFSINLPLSAQKALLHFVRQQMDQVDGSFFMGIGGASTRQVALAINTAIRCLEDRHQEDEMDLSDASIAMNPSLLELRERKNQTYVNRCVPEFLEITPMAKEKAYTAIQSLFAIHKTMLIMSCSENENSFALPERQMKNDFDDIAEFATNYLFTNIPTNTRLHVQGFLGSFLPRK